MVKDKGFYIGAQCNEILTFASKFGEYDEHKAKYSELVNKNASENEFEQFLKIFLKKVLEDVITLSLSEIKKEKRELQCRINKQKKKFEEIKNKLFFNKKWNLGLCLISSPCLKSQSF